MSTINPMRDAEVPHSQGFTEYLAGAPARRFYRGSLEAAEIGKHFPGWIDGAVEEAEDLLKHRLALLRRTLRCRGGGAA
jgi:hypothetical protein